MYFWEKKNIKKKWTIYFANDADRAEKYKESVQKIRFTRHSENF